MDELLSNKTKIIDIHRYLLILYCIYCELILGKNNKYLEMYRNNELQRFISSMKTYPSVLRVNYAYALLKENNSIKAQEFKNKFDKICKTYPYEGDIKSGQELMNLADKVKSEN